MNRIISFTKSFSIIGMFFTFFVASVLDRWIKHAQEIKSEAFPNNFLYMWSINISYLVLALLLTALIWYVFFRVGKSKTIGWIYLSVGLILLLLPLIFLTIPALSPISPPIRLLVKFGPTTLFSTASAFIAGIGIMDLFLQFT